MSQVQLTNTPIFGLIGKVLEVLTKCLLNWCLFIELETVVFFSNTYPDLTAGFIGQRRRPGQPNLTQSFGVERLNYHPGDWRHAPLSGQFWNHLTATRKDVQMLIRYERVEVCSFFVLIKKYHSHKKHS